MGTPYGAGAGGPWKSILIGCLGLALLAGIGIGYTVYQGARMARQVAAQMQQPAAPGSPNGGLPRAAPVPIYPGAQLDAQGTGQVTEMIDDLRKEFGGLGGASIVNQRPAYYRAAATPAAIIAWYDQAMARLGWSAVVGDDPAHRPAAFVMEQRVYQKGGSMLLVMAAVDKTRSYSRMQLMLMDNPAGAAMTP